MERGPGAWSQDSSVNSGPRRSRPHREADRGRASVSSNTRGNGKKSSSTSTTGRTQPGPNPLGFSAASRLSWLFVFSPSKGGFSVSCPCQEMEKGEVKSPVFSHPPSFPARLCFHVKPLTGLDPGPRVPTPLCIPSPFMQTQLPWGLRSAMSCHHMG